MPQTKLLAAPTAATHRKKADHYNDPSHNYRQYWTGREYEDAAERLAIGRLLKGKHFKHAVDVGGGFGRLCVYLEQFADRITLAEPSQQQLDLADDFLKGHDTIEKRLMQADDLKFEDCSIDLLTMVRVMHHLPDPALEFDEIARVLSDDGLAIIEVANYAHARNRLKHFIRGKRIPAKPVDIRSAAHKTKGEIPFVNHNPKTVVRQLAHAGLEVERVLSVSNLRSPRLKKIIPHGVMLTIEKLMQIPLAPMYFGPSIFFLVKKSS